VHGHPGPDLLLRAAPFLHFFIAISDVIRPNEMEFTDSCYFLLSFSFLLHYLGLIALDELSGVAICAI
jgi:hypothetical protein